jgi:hypothetical protein
LSTAKLNVTGLRWVGELADLNFTIRYRPGKANADADTLSRVPKDMDNYMKLCTEETTKDELRTIIQTVNLQEQGKVNWVSSLINDPTIPNIDASRTPKSNGSTLDVDDIRQAQIEDSVIGKVYSFIKADKRPTTSVRARKSTDTQSLLHEWQRLPIGSDGVLRRKKGTHDQIVLPRKYHAMVL